MIVRNKHILNGIPGLLTVLLTIQSLQAQVRFPEFEVLDRGNLWETINDDGRIGYVEPMNPFTYFPSMDWPGGPRELPAKEEQRSYLAGAGLWIGAYQGDELLFTEHGPFDVVDEGTFGPITRHDNFIESADFDSGLPEQTVSTSWLTSENIRVELESHCWSFNGLNNFIIHEYRFTNETGAPLEDLYLGFPWLIRPSYQDLYVHNGWGDDLARMDDVVDYDASRNLIYAYDERMGEDIPWDYGNYNADFRELRTPGYAGLALLHADPAADGSPQPANAFWASILEHTGRFTQTGTTAEALYAIMDGTNTDLQHTGTHFITALTLLSCGPYDLSAGASVSLALAEAVDGLPLDDLVDLEDDGVELQGVQARLPEGLGLLQATIDSAIAVYDNGLLPTVFPPPAPALDVVVVPNQGIDLTWEPVHTQWLALEDVDRRTNSVYRVMRSDHSFNGPWEEVYNKKVRYIQQAAYYDDLTFRDLDENLFVGVEYYYAVTVENEEEQVSWLTNRIDTPMRYGTLPAEDLSAVSVFPNPFREKSGLPAESDRNLITFTNLPATCTVNIYTTDGKRVISFKREDALRGEEVWDQKSSAGIEVVSGIYFWTVESSEGSAKGSLIIIK